MPTPDSKQSPSVRVAKLAVFSTDPNDAYVATWRNLDPSFYANLVASLVAKYGQPDTERLGINDYTADVTWPVIQKNKGA